MEASTAEQISLPCAAAVRYMARAQALLAALMKDDAISDSERLEFLVKLSWYEGDLIRDTMDRMRETMTEAEIGAVCDRIGKPPKRRRKRKQVLAVPKKAEAKCEICSDSVENVNLLCGCEKCGRMYGPCCNSVEDSICVECI